MNFSASHMIPCIVIVFIVLFYLNFYQSSYSFIPASCIKNIIRCEPLKSATSGSEIHQRITGLSDENEFVIFSNESPLVRLYLDVVRDTVCGLTLRTQEKSVTPAIKVSTRQFNLEQRIVGEDWASIGITMIGQKRLINIEWALRFVIANHVPGDFIECGVWRDGSSIFARAILKAFDIKDRHVWVADSFQGLPKARTKSDDNTWSQLEYLRVSLEEVQTNFRAFFLLDDKVHFCKGYFVDALPRCNVSQIAVLRMDGDMYESTMDQLFNLYANVQVGGVIIVDDYTIPVCNKAIHDFRNWHGITEEIQVIPGDNSGRYWIKRKMVKVQMDRYNPLLVSTAKYTP